MTEKTTIRDVAKVAGVSITTISQILRGCGRFSDATIERVWKAVNEMNYTPNEYAKKIFSKEAPERTKTGLLMRVAYFPFDHRKFFPIQSNNVEAYCMLCFEQACQENGYNGTNYHYRHPYGFRSQLLLNGLVDGVVLGTSDSAIIENVKKRVPAVLTNIYVEPEDIGLSVVNADLCSAYAQVFSIIRQAGIMGNMACFSGRDDMEDSVIVKPLAETIPLKKAAERCGIEVNGKYFFNDPVSPETNDSVLETIADRICHLVRNENVRIIVLQAFDPSNIVRMLTDRGLKLPEEAVIVGVRYFPQKQLRGYAQIVYDWKILQETAVDVLVKAIETPNGICGKYLVPCQKITDSFLFDSGN